MVHGVGEDKRTFGGVLVTKNSKSLKSMNNIQVMEIIEKKGFFFLEILNYWVWLNYNILELHIRALWTCYDSENSIIFDAALLRTET